MSKNIPNKKIYAMVISYKSSPVLKELYSRIEKENFDKKTKKSQTCAENRFPGHYKPPRPTMPRTQTTSTASTPSRCLGTQNRFWPNTVFGQIGTVFLDAPKSKHKKSPNLKISTTTQNIDKHEGQSANLKNCPTQRRSKVTRSHGFS